MSRSAALLAGFVVGVVVLGTVGFLLAPSLLGLAGVVIGHSAIQYTAVTSTLPIIIGASRRSMRDIFGADTDVEHNKVMRFFG